MFDVFKFYMPGRWVRPIFGTNSAAANMWLMFVFSVGALLGAVILLVGGGSIEAALVLAGASGVFIVLARVLLPKARRLQEIDQLILRLDRKPH